MVKIPRDILDTIRDEYSKNLTNTWRQRLFLLMIGVPAKIYGLNGSGIEIFLPSSRIKTVVLPEQVCPQLEKAISKEKNIDDYVTYSTKNEWDKLAKADQNEFLRHIEEFNQTNVEVYWFQNFTRLVIPSVIAGVAASLTTEFMQQNRGREIENLQRQLEQERRLNGETAIGFQRQIQELHQQMNNLHQQLTIQSQYPIGLAGAIGLARELMNEGKKEN